MILKFTVSIEACLLHLKSIYETQALIDSESRFKEITSSTNDAIILINNNGKVTFWNNAAEEIFGYSSNEMKGQELHQIIAPKEYYADYKKEFSKFMETGEGKIIGKTIELPAIKKDGETISIELSVSAITIKGKWHAIGIIRDISDRKKADEKIKKSEEKYKGIFNAITDAFAEISIKDGTILEITPSIEQISGYKREELIGKNMADYYVNPEERDMLLRAILKNNGKLNDYEVLLKNKNGKEVPCSFSVIVVVDANGKPDKIVGTMRDISNRNHAEIVLKETEAKLRALLNNSPDSIFVIDKDEKIEFINKIPADYNINEAIGKSVYEFIPKDQHKLHKEKYKEVFESKNVCKAEIASNDGRFHLTRFIPIISKNTVSSVLLIATDVTENRNAKESAEAASKAKDNFLTTMSHEIRTPLNAINGLVKLLEDTELQPKQKAYVDGLDTNVHNLLTVINDILDFSKIESGQLTIEKSPFDIRKLMNRITTTMQFKAEEKGLSLNHYINNRIPNVLLGGGGIIEKELLNIIGNAIKFTEKGSVDVAFNFVSEMDNEIKMTFEVIDTGIGIDSKNINNVFEKFMQEDESTTRKYEGTGLGLAISKKLIEMMAGELKVESTKGRGSRFYFTISLTNTNLDSLPSVSRTPIIPKMLEGRKVLLVEDNQFNQFIAKSVLEKWNTVVVTAENGRIAIDKLKREKFDIILLDLQMPVLGGLDAAKIIREELKDNTPIIALTADVVKGIVDKCMNVGMNDYISKPFEPEELFQKICNHIGTKPIETVNEETQEIAETKETPEEKDSLVVEEKPTKSDIKLFDLKRLSDMLLGNEEQLHKMVEKFLDLAPEYFSDMIDAFNANNIENLAATSHKLKSSVDLIAVDEIRTKMMKISDFTKHNKNIEQIPDLIKYLESNFNIMIKQLKEEINY